MSIPGSLTPLFNSGAGGAAGYQIERSLRFNSTDSAYLSRTPAVAGDRRTWTWAGWVKRSALATGTDQVLFSGGMTNSGTGFLAIYFENNGVFSLGSATTNILTTTPVYRDTGAWAHILFAFNSTAGSNADKAKLYVNGVEVTTFSIDNRSGISNQDYGINQAALHEIGRQCFSSARYFDGYLADIHFIDGQALTPSSFTEVSATTGQLIPLAYSGSFGTNGFWLKFSDNSAATAATLGKDYSGNSNNWTPNNLSTSTGGPTSVAAASGALPVFNTTDTYGAVKGTGTRTDTYSSYISLALPMDGTNGGTSFGDQSAVIKGSGSAQVFTLIGNTNTSTAQSKFYGSSGYFDGSGDGMYSSSTSALDVSTGDWTIECWSFLTTTSGTQMVVGYNNTSASDFWDFTIVSGVPTFKRRISGVEVSVSGGAVTAQTWTHLAISRSGTQITLYVNGVNVASNASVSMPTSMSDLVLGIGYNRYGGGYEYYYNGYIQDLRIYKGVTKYTGNFNPPSSTANATIGAGNDSLVDTPTSIAATDTGVGNEVRGNYATLNPLLASGGSGTLTNGNLDSSYSSGGWYSRVGTIYASSGKYYWEHTITAGSTNKYVFTGIATPAYNGTDFPGSGAGNSYAWYGNEGNLRPTAQAGWNVTYDNGDVIGVALDMDNGKLYFSKNGTFVNSSNPATQTNPQVTGLAGYAWAPAISYFTGYGGTVNFGQRAFAYTAPSGFKALCDTNLGAPVVAKPNTVMDVVTRAGGGTTQTFATLRPGLVWEKRRDSSSNHYLFDVNRGNDNYLSSNLTSAEAASAGAFTFNTNSYTVSSGFDWPGGATVVDWVWDAGTSTVSNTAGSITSQVRANASAGFSVVTYSTGASSGNQTIGHGLNVTPSLIIHKVYSATSNWWVYHASTTNTVSKYLQLNSTNATADNIQSMWGAALPTSTVFGANVGQLLTTNQSAVAYCFAPVVGYSSFGSYVAGSGEPFVYLGFKPALVIIKAAVGRDTAYTSWYIADNKRPAYNPENLPLWANQSAQEGLRGNGSGVYSSDLNIDLLSNGFKIRDNNGAPDETNFTGATYIYCAWAENPFQYARAR